MCARACWYGFASGCAVLALSGVLRAQDSAAAQALFERGVADLEAGNVERACPVLAESHRLDPHPGTLFALAECEAKADKFASAVGHYQDYLGLVSRLSSEQQERHAERVAHAREQTQALRPQVPTLTLVLPVGAPRDLVVERDGVVLQAPALGVALPIDPGEHVVVTRDAAGNESRATIAIAAGEAVRLELRLPEAPRSENAASVTPAPVLPPVPPLSPLAPAPLRAQRSPALRTWGWIAGGLGLTSVAVGSMAGAVALGKKGTVSKHCRGEACDAEGKRAADAGHTAATASTVAFGVGLVGLGTSLVLLLTSDEPASASAKFRPTLELDREGASAGWEGVF
jgi:hypothetical protein